MKGMTESQINNLSFAILVVDTCTREQPVGFINVQLNNENLQAIKNSSGYYVFLNLRRDNYTLNVNSEFYFDASLDVSISSLNPLNPVKEIELMPTPAYPFPNGATLIRGTVLDSAQRTLSNATVEVREKKIKSLTSQKGDFALYFPPLRKDEIVMENGKRFVKTAKGKKICVTANFGKQTGMVTLDGVEEGVCNNVKYILLR